MRNIMRKEMKLSASPLSYLVPENIIELRTYYLSLLLGIGNSPESTEKPVLAVHTDKVHIKKLCKGLLNKVTLVLAHESLIHEHAGELLSHSTAEKSCCNRGINTA